MEKIEALKKTIYNLETNRFPYKWDTSETCNCGILSQSIGLREEDIDIYGAYSGRVCNSTGMPLGDVFRALKGAGFNYREICQLEFLSNETIAKRAGIRIAKVGLMSQFSEYTSVRGIGYMKKQTLIKYLKAWVSILEESSQMPISEPDVQASVATVDAT